MKEKLLQKLQELGDKMESINHANKEILTLDDAANYMQVSKSYIYKLTSCKQIPHYKPSGKLIYFKKKELDQWILENRECSKADFNEIFLAELKNKRNGSRRN